MTAKLLATAPVLAANDVAATAKWYSEHLGFRADLFPDRPPHAFAILSRDEVEIMLRQCQPALRAEADWDVYVRMEGVAELYQAVRGRVAVVEPLERKGHGCLEFAVDDPNGFRLVFSQKVDR